MKISRYAEINFEQDQTCESGYVWDKTTGTCVPVSEVSFDDEVIVATPKSSFPWAALVGVGAAVFFLSR